MIKSAVLITWFRIVDLEGAVIDRDWMGTDIIDCGPVELSERVDRGLMIMDGKPFVYLDRFYNEGSPTPNPNTSGQQLVYIVDSEAVFRGDFSACFDVETGEAR